MIKKRFFLNFFFIISIFFIDRITKFLMIYASEELGITSVNLTSFLNLNLIWNNGIAFGLFSFDEKIYYNFFTTLIILITFVILWMLLKTKKIERLAFMMIFGGSLGNIFDRLFYSAVPDFIDFHIKNFHWFIFNVADIFISLGVILLIYLEFFKKDIYV
tara:strand:+ start:2515 stop:2994 length:480 start_codon:yes stop_codon:yes gene_type:complete